MTTDETIEEQVTPITLKTLGIWCCVPLLAVVVLVLGIMWFNHVRNQQKLAELVNDIAKAGEPVDGLALNQLRIVPAGVQDLTPAWQSILNNIKTKTKPAKQKILQSINSEIDFESVNYLTAFRDIIDRDKIPPVGEPWENKALAEDYLAMFSTEFKQLEELVQKPGMTRFTKDYTIHLNYTEDISELRNLCQLLNLRSKLQLHNGNTSEALTTLNICYAVANTLNSEYSILDFLSYVALIGMTNNQIPEFIAAGATDSQLLRLQDILASVDHQRTFQLAAIGNRASTISLLNSKKSITVFEDAVNLTNKQELSDVWNSRPGDCSLLLEHLTAGVQASTLTIPEMLQAGKIVQQNVDAVKTENQKCWKFQRNLITVTYALSEEYFEALARNLAEHRATLTMIAMERHFLAHGKYAESLAELAKILPKKFLEDPYTGKYLQLKQNDTSYSIYSIGQNLTDDNGNFDWKQRDKLDFGVTISKRNSPQKP
jgi:hypothetical protein